MTELCRVWADLAADPENAAAVTAARSRLVELAAHMGTCDACGLVSESMPFPERVFAVLGENVDLSREELNALHDMDELAAFGDLLNELKDAVAAGMRLLELKPADKRLAAFVEQIRSENAKIIEMMAPLAVTDDDGQAGQAGRAGQAGKRSAEREGGTSMVAVVQHLRMVERKKRRCLSAIANAPVAAIGRSQTAMAFKTFAAKSQAVAARNIIELGKFVKV